jgi:tRNA-dihydrouridine synthase
MVPFEIWPGPMEGVGSAQFVKTVNHLKLVDKWMTPFLRISSTIPKLKLIEELINPFLSGNVPVTLQIMGNNPSMLEETAKLASKLPIVGINLNAGCPSKRVCSNGAGGGLWKNPTLIKELLLAIKNGAPNLEVSLKTRLGINNPEESYDILANLAQSNACDKYFIHYRTVNELYNPAPNREARLKKAVEILKNYPCIVNGNINSVEDGTKLLETTASSGIMCARFWVQDPWLLKRFDPNNNAPDSELGRKEFFQCFCSFNVPKGAKLEIAKMLWGVKSKEFTSLL